MSFSSEIKEELSKISNLAKKDEVKYELIGYLISKNTTISQNNLIRYATENDYNINRYSKLLKNLQINHDIEFDGKAFIIYTKIANLKNIINVMNDNIYIKNIDENEINENNKKAVIRGAFLGAGSINNLDKKYHLEINLSNKENLEFMDSILKFFYIKSKILKTENKNAIYLKDGEEISTLIALIGSNKGVLQFEDMRVKREMSGKVNRIVNCKTANLNKTINASIEQIDAIKKLQQTNEFNKLDDNLKEIALLRLENPDMSLIELGKNLSTPIGKSGVNYRLRKIVQLSKEY